MRADPCDVLAVMCDASFNVVDAANGFSNSSMADCKITRFRAYFDPHDLGLQIEQTSQGR